MGIKSTLYKAFAKDHNPTDALRFAFRLLGMDVDSDKEDTGWRTTENGKHYQINKEGTVVKGPKAMVGGNVNDPATWNGGSSAPNGKPSKLKKEHPKKDKPLGNLNADFPFKSISDKAKKHKDSYDEWASSLTFEEAKAIEDQYHAMADADPKFSEDGHYESISDYYERIHRMLAAEGDGKQHRNKPVNGRDMSDDYEWDKKPYTDSIFGQVIDTPIEDVIHKQGFDGVPKVVSKEEFDKMIEANSSLPVLMRTVSAPTKETVEAYDSDLESGAWYVDCSVGGSAHGTGMYTAFTPAFDVVDIDKLSDRGFTSESQLRNVLIRIPRTKEGYYLKENLYERKNAEMAPKGTAFFRGDEIYVVDKPGETLIDAETGEELEFEDLFYASPIWICEKSKPGDNRNWNRPLGQMRMYIDLNERREREYAEDLYDKRCQELADTSFDASTTSLSLDKPMPDTVYTYDMNGDYVFFNVVDKGGIPLQETCTNGFDEFDLEPGYYMISYDHSSEPGYRNFELVEVTKDKFILSMSNDSAIELTDFDRSFAGNGQNRNPVIHKCEDITPKSAKRELEKWTKKVEILNAESSSESDTYGPNIFEGHTEAPTKVKTHTTEGTAFFSIDPESKRLTKEEYDKLAPGDYLFTYDNKGDSENKRMSLIHVDEDGVKSFINQNAQNTPDKGFSVIESWNPEVHKCENITPVKPEVEEDTVSTITRKMTIDPSFKSIKEDEIRGAAMVHNTKIQDEQKKAIRDAVDNYSPSDKSITAEELRLIKDSAGAATENGDEDFMEMLGFADTWNDKVKVQQRWKDLSSDRMKVVKDELARMNDITQNIYDKYERRKIPSHDVGVMCAMLGYDGMIGADANQCPNYGCTLVVYNRTKLILSEERVDVPEGIPT